MRNYHRGAQHTVTRNVVRFLPGDLVGSRLSHETFGGIVTEVHGMDAISIRHAGKVETFDSDYFYIIKGVDETDDERFHRATRYEELTRIEVRA